MSIPRKKAAAALKHLQSVDPVMRELIRRVGPFRLRLERDRFGLLVRSILSQQISMKAARSIRQQLERLVAPEQPTAENLAALSDRRLRSAGLSGQKVGYVRDLCSAVLENRLSLRHIGRKSDERVVAELTRVKGIGRWTAQMFLIFSLGRLDVFPHEDLGIRASLRDLYHLHELPDKQTGLRIAEPWRPYATVASWYCWRSADQADDQLPPVSGYPV